MDIFTNRDTKFLFSSIAAFLAGFLLLSQLGIWVFRDSCMPFIAILSIIAGSGIAAACFRYFYKQHELIGGAVSSIDSYLKGDTNARIECDREGEIYKLFHSVNTLAAVLNAHAENEFRAKEFLKDTISDISHQLKTPLAALSIYNEMLQGETEDIPEIRKFTMLSEQELARIETLVQNLLEITKLDAGTIVIDKDVENIADMMRDIELHFAYRAKQENKKIILSGADNITLFCDRDWIIEAISNIVKNALDHTGTGDRVVIEWKGLPDLTQIVVKDSGSGIHPEDIHYIFKRFYRSRFSKDTQGIGLGLPLAKAIVEAHDGNITVDSELGKGSVFQITFLNSDKITKL